MGERDPLGLTPSAWEAFVIEAGLPRYRGRQIFDAIHRRGVRDYSGVTELPAALRERFAREAPIRLPEIVSRDESADGSVKFGLRLSDGALIEAVYEEAKAAGSPRVYWHTHETNKTAMRLYDHVATHSGFVVYRKDL